LNTTDFAALGLALSAWSLIIGLIIGLLKRGAEVSEAELSPARRVLVRLLPLLPMALGAATGALGALELILALVGFYPPADWTVSLPLMGSFVGAGAGAISGQTVKAYKQTFKGQDERLTAGGGDGG
jgi:hypothetical protein